MKNLTLILIMMSLSQAAFTQQITNPKSLFDPTPYGFSHVVVVPSGKGLVFIAGQGGEEDNPGTLDPDFRNQVHQVLSNIATALETQELSLDDVVKVTTLVVDHNQDKLNIIVEEFNRYWPKKNFPANTLIPVPKLALEGMQVEIEAIAVSK